jgi:hypothetical protein
MRSCQIPFLSSKRAGFVGGVYRLSRDFEGDPRQSAHDVNAAEWVHLSHDVLATIGSRIANEVKGVNRVVYDVSSKPPSTIGWE